MTRHGVDVDGDGLADLPHGEVVQAFLTAKLPRAEVTPLPLTSADPAALSRALDDVLKAVKAEKDRGNTQPFGVNLSLGTQYVARDNQPALPTTVEGLARVTGQRELTPDTLARQRADIRKALSAPLAADARPDAEMSGYRTWAPAIERLEKLTEAGVVVTIGAGNLAQTPDKQHPVNLLSLASGVDTVAATDPFDRPIERFTRNSLVTRSAQGSFMMNRTDDGVDLNGDGKTDVPRAKLTGNGSVALFYMLEGTSIAAPNALAERLSQPSRTGPNR
jgi:hypothetical protein